MSEITILKQLSHPNITSIFDVLEQDVKGKLAKFNIITDIFKGGDL